MRVGIAKVNLNPDIPVTIDGFGARNGTLSEGITHDIEGVCFVFDNGETRVGIMSLDLLAMDDYMMVPIRQAAKALGIPAKNMMVNTSHTHAAPNVTPCRTFMRAYEDEYLAATRDKLCKLIADAVDDLQEVTLDYTVGTCTLGCNRRRHGSSGLLPNPDKPIDLDVPVLRVLDGEGNIRGILFGYACHPSAISGPYINSDYPGYAKDLLRESIPGCIPAFLQGCGGDVKPRNIDPVLRNFKIGPLEAIESIGHELGRAVQAALCGEPMPLDETLRADSEFVQIPFGPQPTEEEVAEAQQDGEGSCARIWGDAVRSVWDMGHKLSYQLPIEVQVFNIGGLDIVAIAAEVCVEVGLHIKDMFPERTVMTLGYTNGAWDYFAPGEAHTEDGYTEGYEVKRSFVDTIWPWPQPLGFSDDSEDIMLESIQELVEGLQAEGLKPRICSCK